MTKKTIDRPNYTQMPNVLFDEHLADMNVAELKVTLAICRETFGWHRPAHQLSYTDLEKMTGLSRKSIKAGIDKGIERQTIKREPRGQSFVYSLVVEEGNQDTKVTSVDQETKVTTAGDPSPLPAVEEGNQSGNDIKEKKETKKKEKESSATVFALYEANIGPLTPIIGDDLGDLLDTYGEEWTRQAIEVAAERNARNIRYIEATLKGCKAEGKPPKAPISLEKKLARKYDIPDYADPPAPEPPPLRVLIEGEGKWQEIAAILKTQLPQETYDSWLSSAVFLGLEDEYFRVGVDRVEAQKVLGGRLYDVILRAVRAVTDEEADIRFEIINGAARRKPGEPDARLGTPAPQTAGHNRPRPKEQIA